MKSKAQHITAWIATSIFFMSVVFGSPPNETIPISPIQLEESVLTNGLELDSQLQKLEIRPNIKLSLEEAYQITPSLWKPLDKMPEKFSGKGEYWFRLKVKNPTDRKNAYVLFLKDVQQANIYYQSEYNSANDKTGLLVPYSEKQSPDGIDLFGMGISNQSVFHLDAGASYDIHIQVIQSSSFPFFADFKLYGLEAWDNLVYKESKKRNFLQGLFQGTIWLLIIYHFVLFWVHRSKAYLYYTLYMLVISVCELGAFGILQDYFLPNSPRLTAGIYGISHHACYLAFFLFMYAYLNLSKLPSHFSKPLDQFKKFHILAFLVFGTWFSITLNYDIFKVLLFLTNTIILVGVWVIWRLFKNPNPKVRSFLIGTLLLLFGAIPGSVLNVAPYLQLGISSPFSPFYLIEIGILAQLILFAIGLSTEIGERKNEEKQVYELEQTKSRFFQNISHEFRTPLTLILGPVKRLMEQSQNPEVTKDLDLIKLNGLRMLRLINQLLDLSKLESGNLPLKASRADLCQFIEQIIASFKPLSEIREITIRQDFPDEVVTLWFDGEKLEKILNNLITNGFKFTPSPGTITIKVREVEQGDFVEISVKDSGIGIALEQQERIFDRFYQAEERQQKGVLGTGIGLALTKELVELHHGSIWVESDAGHGSTFIVKLPTGARHLRKKEKSPRPEVFESKEEESIPQAYALATAENTESGIGETNTPVILLVEDNLEMRAFIRSGLVNRFHILEASHGKSGLEKAIKHIPDLIISDVMMPVMDGISLCKAVKREEKTSHIPVILLTARGSKESKLSGLEVGADAYMSKPFDQDELLIRIKNLLNNRQRILEKFNKEYPLQLEHTEFSNSEKRFLEKVNQLISENMDNPSFGVTELLTELAMSRTQLHRKLRALTDQSTSNYIRSVRLEHAYTLLKDGDYNVSEVAYLSGFNSQSYFSRCFTQQFGLAPSELK